MPNSIHGEGPKEFQFLARGQVAWRHGLPIPDVLVRAFNKNLRDEDLLAEGTTNKEGNFELWYSMEQLRQRSESSASA